MTRRTGLAAATLFAAAALGLASCGGDDEEGAATTAAQTETETQAEGGGTKLEGYVGPGFDIKLEDVDGVTAGTYTLSVEDKSPSHNFHLIGPGVDVKTEVSFEGEKTFTVTLQAGEYHYQCDPHSSSMHGSFTVS